MAVSGIVAFDIWFGGGVPAWPGFGLERFVPLNTSLNKLKGSGETFRIMLDEALDVWEGLSIEGVLPGENILRENLLVLLARLNEANRSAVELNSAAGLVKAEAATLSGAVDRFMAAEINEQNAAQAEIASLHVQIQAQQAVYRSARAELEGDKGFLNGFLTGITLGSYNPLKQNMDRANDAIATINGRIAAITQNMNLIGRRQSEINEAKNVIARLGIIDADMANCQNALNQAIILLADSIRSFDNAEAVERPRIFIVFVQAGAPKMGRLRQWERDFAALS